MLIILSPFPEQLIRETEYVEVPFEGQKLRIERIRINFLHHLVGSRIDGPSLNRSFIRIDNQSTIAYIFPIVNSVFRMEFKAEKRINYFVSLAQKLLNGLRSQSNIGRISE